MASDEAQTRDGSRATLEILGTPGGAVSIYARKREDARPPAIWEGEVPADGRLRLRVPRAYLVVVAAGHGTTPVHFEDGLIFQSVDIRNANE